MLLLLEWPVTTTVTIEQEERVKSREEIMNMLEAFDLTGSLRGAGELAGVLSSHRGPLCLELTRFGRHPDPGILGGSRGESR